MAQTKEFTTHLIIVKAEAEALLRVISALEGYYQTFVRTDYKSVSICHVEDASFVIQTLAEIGAELEAEVYSSSNIIPDETLTYNTSGIIRRAKQLDIRQSN